MRAIAKRRKGFHFEVEVDGHLVVVDEPEDAGGTDVGPSPTRLLAASLASCTAITIAMYSERKGWDIEGLEVAVDFEGLPKDATSTTFVVTLIFPASLGTEQTEKLRVIAGKCPVHRILTGETTVEIRDEPAA